LEDVMTSYRALPWVLLLVPLAALTAPAQPAPGGEAALVGPVWRLERILYNDGKEIRPAAGNRYTMQFLANRRLEGQADLNRLTGTYTVSGTTLAIGPLASTRIADPPGSIAGEFTKALGQASSFRVNGDRLLVELKFDSGTMTFVRPTVEPPSVPDSVAIAPIVGAWLLIRMNESPLPSGGEIPTIEFEAGGSVGGTTGVNRYRATADVAQLAEGRLALGQVAMTQRAGPPEAMKRESDFVSALRQVRVWKLSGRTLFLEDDRNAILVFRRRS
jgi:heat shock protein HslJ